MGPTPKVAPVKKPQYIYNANEIIGVKYFVHYIDTRLKKSHMPYGLQPKLVYCR